MCASSRASAERALLSVIDSLDGVVFAGQSDGFQWLDLTEGARPG